METADILLDGAGTFAVVLADAGECERVLRRVDLRSGETSVLARSPGLGDQLNLSLNDDLVVVWMERFGPSRVPSYATLVPLDGSPVHRVRLPGRVREVIWVGN